MTFFMRATEDPAAPRPDADEPSEGRGEIRPWEYVRPDFRVLEGGIPAFAFLIVNSLWDTRVAIGISFAASIWVFVRNQSSGVIRFLSVMSFLITAGSAAVGLAFSSDTAFVAQNMVSDFVVAVVMVGSVLIGRPLVGAVSRQLVPQIQPVMQLDHPTFRTLTLVSAGINIFTGVIRIFMLDAMSANAYLILSRVVFIPLNIAFYVLCYVLISRVAIRTWPADEPLPPKTRVAEVLGQAIAGDRTDRGDPPA
jgi:intracellular septation protein A